METNFYDNGKLLIGVTESPSLINLHTYLIFIKKNVCKNIKIIFTEEVDDVLKKDVLSPFLGVEIYSGFNDNLSLPSPHISLTKWADAFLVFPANATILAKAARGIADNLLSLAILASTIPTIFIPLLSQTLSKKQIVIENIKSLENQGYFVLMPEATYEEQGDEEELVIDPVKTSIKIKRIINKTIERGILTEDYAK